MNGYSEQRKRSARLEVGAAGSGTLAISPDTPGEMSGPKPGEKRGVRPEVASVGVSAFDADGIERELGIRLMFDMLADDNPLMLSPGIVRPMPMACVEESGCVHSDEESTPVSGSNVGVFNFTDGGGACPTDVFDDGLPQCGCCC